MTPRITYFFMGLFLFFSCSEKDEEPTAVNFTVFSESVCSETFSRLCVSQDEFIRLREIFEDNQNEGDLECLPVTVTDLDGTIHEGFLRGLSSTGADIPCIQELDIL